MFLDLCDISVSCGLLQNKLARRPFQLWRTQMIKLMPSYKWFHICQSDIKDQDEPLLPPREKQNKKKNSYFNKQKPSFLFIVFVNAIHHYSEARVCSVLKPTIRGWYNFDFEKLKIQFLYWCAWYGLVYIRNLLVYFVLRRHFYGQHSNSTSSPKT